MYPACAHIKGQAELGILVDAPANTISGLKDRDRKASGLEERSSSKPIHTSPYNADLSQVALTLGMDI